MQPMKKSKSRSSKKQPTKRKRQPDVLAPAPTGPTLIPPTDGTCSTCFYSRLIGAVRTCRADRPILAQGVPAQPGQGWPIVTDGDWCADGVDATTYKLFAPDWY
jgi:hypothetical protein